MPRRRGLAIAAVVCGLLVALWVVWILAFSSLRDALGGSSTDSDDQQESTLSEFEEGLRSAGADGAFGEDEVTAAVGTYWSGSVTPESLTIVVHIPGESTSPQCFELRALVVSDGVDVTTTALPGGCIADLERH